MSELKGTLLAIILTLVLFGTISVCMNNTFSNMSETISHRVTEIVDTTN